MAAITVGTAWEKISAGYRFLIGNQIVGHVWKGQDGDWRGATIGDGTFFGPFDKESDAREAVSTTALDLKNKKHKKMGGS